jgi:hypothetical protein
MDQLHFLTRLLIFFKSNILFRLKCEIIETHRLAANNTDERVLVEQRTWGVL